jgi:uncharacterized protein YjiS (DUF1127 family)
LADLWPTTGAAGVFATAQDMRALHNRRAGSALPHGGGIAYLSFCPTGQVFWESSTMITTIAKRLKAYRDYRSVLGQLSHMSIHELDDIGITRADIERIARGAAR